MPRLLLIANEVERYSSLLLEALRERASSELVCANAGADATLTLTSSPFDVLFVVPKCPLQEGVSIVREVRGGHMNADIPIVIMAEELSCAHHVALRRAGIDHVLFLPCSAMTVERCLDEVLHTPQRSVGVLEHLDRMTDSVRELQLSHG
jgi:DNA-binding response OmpR family regulator